MSARKQAKALWVNQGPFYPTLEGTKDASWLVALNLKDVDQQKCASLKLVVYLVVNLQVNLVTKSWRRRRRCLVEQCIGRRGTVRTPASRSGYPQWRPTAQWGHIAKNILTPEAKIFSEVIFAKNKSWPFELGRKSFKWIPSKKWIMLPKNKTIQRCFKFRDILKQHQIL